MVVAHTRLQSLVAHARVGEAERVAKLAVDPAEEEQVARGGERWREQEGLGQVHGEQVVADAAVIEPSLVMPLIEVLRAERELRGGRKWQTG